MLLTSFVMKLSKFNEFNFKHPLNIYFILVTFEVSKLDKYNETNFLFSENI